MVRQYTNDSKMSRVEQTVDLNFFLRNRHDLVESVNPRIGLARAIG